MANSSANVKSARESQRCVMVKGGNSSHRSPCLWKGASTTQTKETTQRGGNVKDEG